MEDSTNHPDRQQQEIQIDDELNSKLKTESKNSKKHSDRLTVFQKNFSKKPLLITAGIVVIGIAGIFGYRWWHYASTHETTDDAYVTGHIHPVSSRIAGTVIVVPVDDNQEVNEGQSLVELDPKDYQVAVQQAQASLENAKSQANKAQASIALAAKIAQADTSKAQGSVGDAIASIASAQASVSQAQAGIATAQDKLIKAQAQEANAKITYERYQQLNEGGAIAKQQRDDALTSYQVAQAQVKSAEQGVIDAKAQYQTALESVAQARAKLVDSQGRVQQAQAGSQQTEVNRQQYQAALAQIATVDAALKQAQLNLAYTNITATVPGKVGDKTVEVGQRVQPDQPLMSIVSDRSWIVANFNETQLGKIQPGEEVDIQVDALGGKTFKGTVNSISPASGSDFSLLPPDNATGNFTKVVQRIPVKITFDPNSIKGYDNRITPGMSAEVSVDVESK